MSKWKRTSALRSTDFKTREEDGKRYIDAYFAVFNSEYWLREGVACEVIEPTAFNLSRDTDVRALTNHDTTLVLGRTTVGTLRLGVDGVGLYGTIEINEDDQDAVNSWARVNRGDVSQCSFGFNILDERKEVREDGTVCYHLLGVELFEVSICTFPAYRDTQAEARADEAEAALAARKNEQWRADMLARLKGV